LGFVLNNPNCPVHIINFTIYQPRPHHPDGKVRRWTIARELLDHLYNELNARLSNPSDELVSNPLCKNCPAAVNCPAFRKAQFNSIDAAEMAFNDSLDNNTLSYMIDTIERASKVLEHAKKAYHELAMHRLKEGQVIDNRALEIQYGHRDWRDGVTPEFVQMLTGKDLTKKKLISPAQAEKQGVSPEVVKSLCEKRSTGVKLVRVSATDRAKKLMQPTN
jgi:hypothetical protein